MALTEIRVTDSEVDPTGAAISAGGTAIFALSDQIIDATDGTTYMPAPITGTYNASGALVGPDGNPGVLLVANNDPKAEPQTTTYIVVKRLIGVPNPPTREVSVPYNAAGGTVALAALPTVVN